MPSLCSWQPLLRRTLARVSASNPASRVGWMSPVNSVHDCEAHRLSMVALCAPSRAHGRRGSRWSKPWGLSLQSRSPWQVSRWVQEGALGAPLPCARRASVPEPAQHSSADFAVVQFFGVVFCSPSVCKIVVAKPVPGALFRLRFLGPTGVTESAAQNAETYSTLHGGAKSEKAWGRDGVGQ